MDQFFQPEEVLATRTIMKGSVLEPQVLIKWQGTTDSEATREGLKEFNREFPAKVVFNGGGTVTCTAEVEKDDSKDTQDSRHMRTKWEVVRPQAQGHLSADLGIKECRRSNRMRESHRRIEGYVRYDYCGTILSLSDILFPRTFSF